MIELGFPPASVAMSLRASASSTPRPPVIGVMRLIIPQLSHGMAASSRPRAEHP